MSRHPSRPVPIFLSCPVNSRQGMSPKGMKGTKIFKSVYIATESTPECQKAKGNCNEISILLHFPSYFSLFWAVSSVLRCLRSRLDSSWFFEPSLDLSRPAKNLSRHNTSLRAGLQWMWNPSLPIGNMYVLLYIQ